MAHARQPSDESGKAGNPRAATEMAQKGIVLVTQQVATAAAAHAAAGAAIGLGLDGNAIRCLASAVEFALARVWLHAVPTPTCAGPTRRRRRRRDRAERSSLGDSSDGQVSICCLDTSCGESGNEFYGIVTADAMVQVDIGDGDGNGRWADAASVGPHGPPDGDGRWATASPVGPHGPPDGDGRWADAASFGPHGPPDGDGRWAAASPVGPHGPPDVDGRWAAASPVVPHGPRDGDGRWAAAAPVEPHGPLDGDGRWAVATHVGPHGPPDVDGSRAAASPVGPHGPPDGDASWADDLSKEAVEAAATAAEEETPRPAADAADVSIENELKDYLRKLSPEEFARVGLALRLRAQGGAWADALDEAMMSGLSD